MSRMKNGLRMLLPAAALFLAPAIPSQAQDGFIAGVYLESAKLCEQAKKESLQTVIEASNLVLTSRGFESIEYNCVFLQVLKNPHMPSGWVVTAMCEEPGLAAPDMLSIVERQAGQLEIVSMADDDDGEADGLSGTWHRCDGIEAP
jgi:hypothetical protein